MRHSSRLLDLQKSRDLYSHKPLDTSRQEIRLLRLLPADSELICCEIIHVSLNDPPEYDALSYVWGNPARTETIMVDGQMLGVTVNLLEALKILRPGQGEKRTSLEDPWSSDPRFTQLCHSQAFRYTQNMSSHIWIDAICINQDGYDERNHEVLKMGRIYGQAETVVAWLGPGGKGNDEAFDLLQCLHWVSNRSQDDICNWLIEKCAINLQQAFSALQCISLAPWFGRI